MMYSFFSFLWKTFAFATTTVMGVSAACYIGNYITKSMINDGDDESDVEVEDNEVDFEKQFDVAFKSLEKGEVPSKDEREKYISTVETPIGDVLMIYDIESFYLNLLNLDLMEIEKVLSF